MDLRVDLTRCCPEAQADGVPCPILGRSCETCDRAIKAERDLRGGGSDAPQPPIRPVGCD